VVRRGFVPERGNIVWLSFAPQLGRDQAGRRPALVLSPRRYNERVGLALVCPITSRIKGYPFRGVPLRGAATIAGVTLADHLRSLDWRARRAALAGQAPPDVVSDVVARLRPLIGA
jgi:mRNA interferase MazF